MKSILLKIFIISFIVFLGINTKATCQIVDSAQCVAPIGVATEGTCVMWPLVPPIANGQIVTRCFTYDPNYIVSHLSYIILNSTCGPFAPYNSLTYNLYNSTCDSLIMSGEIFPTPVNSDIGILDTVGVTYVLCYTWNALCDQFAVCPIINGSPLPIELISFEGKKHDNYNVLSWATATETNNSLFTIERGDAIDNFSAIGFLNGAGNSTSIKNYQYTDSSPFKADNYYRIKQTDYDGNFTYSKIIFLNNKEKSNLLFVEVYNVLGEGLAIYSKDDIEYNIEHYLQKNKIYFLKYYYDGDSELVKYKKIIKF